MNDYIKGFDSLSETGLMSTDGIEWMDELRKEMEKTKSASYDLFETLLKEAKEYKDKIEKDNPYAELMEQAKKENEELTTNIGYYRDAMEKRLAVDKWYSQEFDKLMKNKQGLSPEEQNKAMMDLGELYNQKYAQADEEVWQERGSKVADIMGNGFTDMITEYEHFGDKMKDIATSLADYMIQESLRAVTQQIMSTQKVQSLLGSIFSAGSSKGGLFGVAANFFKGFGRRIGLPTFHDGGVVPVGANTEIQGTQEQLALLKGGERILSPGENANYSSRETQSSPVVFNNFNVKAWDSKDVSRYLLENKQLLNQITYDGIKNNYAHLRHIIQNA